MQGFESAGRYITRFAIMAAQSVFVELKAAYDANDLTRVTEILSNLERRKNFKPKQEAVSEKEGVESAA